MSKHNEYCQALVPRRTGSWFDFTGCLNPRLYDVDVVTEDALPLTVHLCGSHKRVIDDHGLLDVHDGTYTGYTNRPVLVSVRHPEKITL